MIIYKTGVVYNTLEDYIDNIILNITTSLKLYAFADGVVFYMYKNNTVPTTDIFNRIKNGDGKAREDTEYSIENAIFCYMLHLLKEDKYTTNLSDSDSLIMIRSIIKNRIALNSFYYRTVESIIDYIMDYFEEIEKGIDERVNHVKRVLLISEDEYIRFISDSMKVNI